jgi:VanZ family protein
MVLILALSSQSDLPARTNPQTGETVRVTFTAAKLAHVFEYSVLGLLLLRALVGADGGVRMALGPATVLAVVLAGAFGGLDELRQTFVPRREPRFSDIAIDTVSAFLAVMLAGGWLRYRRTPPTPNPVPTAVERVNQPATGRWSPPLPRAGEGGGGRGDRGAPWARSAGVQWTPSEGGEG